MKEIVTRLISMQIQKLLIQRNENLNNQNNLSKSEFEEESTSRDCLTREITVWQNLLLIIEKLLR